MDDEIEEYVDSVVDDMQPRFEGAALQLGISVEEFAARVANETMVRIEAGVYEADRQMKRCPRTNKPCPNFLEECNEVIGCKLTRTASPT